MTGLWKAVIKRVREDRCEQPARENEEEIKMTGWRERQKCERDEGPSYWWREWLCGLRCGVFWHAVIKPSSTLTGRHLFTADFNFLDSPFPLPITSSPPCHTPPYPLSPFLSLTCFSVCVYSFSLAFSLSLFFSPITWSRNPACTHNVRGCLAAKDPFFLLRKFSCFISIHFCLFIEAWGKKNCWSISAMFCVIS